MNAYTLIKSLLPFSNKCSWLEINLSTARNDVSLQKSGISIATHPDWLGNGIFTLKLKNIDDTLFALIQDDLKKITSLNTQFKDIIITNTAQPNVIIKFFIAEHLK